MAGSLQSRTEARGHRDARYAEHQHGRDEKRRVEGAVSTASAMIFGQPAMAVKGLHWHFLFCSSNARKTFSGVIGKSRMRTPTASSIALAIAGATVNAPVSPTPFAPKGPSSCGT